MHIINQKYFFIQEICTEEKFEKIRHTLIHFRRVQIPQIPSWDVLGAVTTFLCDAFLFHEDDL